MPISLTAHIPIVISQEGRHSLKGGHHTPEQHVRGGGGGGDNLLQGAISSVTVHYM